MATDGRCCPVCGAETAGVDAMARHLVERATVSDGSHVMWLNRKVTKHRVPAAELAILLEAVLAGRRPPAPRVPR
jgi:hypothetical protein